jgi:hypothetical protein
VPVKIVWMELRIKKFKEQVMRKGQGHRIKDVERKLVIGCSSCFSQRSASIVFAHCMDAYRKGAGELYCLEQHTQKYQPNEVAMVFSISGVAQFFYIWGGSYVDGVLDKLVKYTKTLIAGPSLSPNKKHIESYIVRYEYLAKKVIFKPERPATSASEYVINFFNEHPNVSKSLIAGDIGIPLKALNKIIKKGEVSLDNASIIANFFNLKALATILPESTLSVIEGTSPLEKLTSRHPS